MYITGKDKLVSYFADGWYRKYNDDIEEWKKLIKKPEWMDECTNGCAHPDGVILAGAEDHNTGNHVVLLNVRTKQTVPLPGKLCDVHIWNYNNNYHLHKYIQHKFITHALS